MSILGTRLNIKLAVIVYFVSNSSYRFERFYMRAWTKNLLLIKPGNKLPVGSVEL